MRNRYYILLFCLSSFLLISFNCNSQQINKNSLIISQYFQLNNNSSMLAEKNALNNSNIQYHHNLIQVNQIGDNNKAFFAIGNNDTQNLKQIGNENNYQFINFYNKDVSLLNVVQQGNSNFLQIYGKNSIINKMNIIQKSSYKTIVIRNF